LLNVVSDVVRSIARPRSNRTDRSANGPKRPATARHVHRRAIGAARFLAHFLTPTPRSRERLASQVQRAAPAATPTRTRSARRRLYRRQLALRLTSNRTIPAAIALIVVLAAGASLAPVASPVGAAQGAQAQAQNVRLVVGGGAAMAAVDDGLLAGTDGEAATDYVDDGTLYKPVAVDTTVQSASSLMRQYKVQSGDTLTGIASRFGVSMMTLWWANKITSKDALHVGQTLIIPPVTGLVYTVQVGDTLDSVSAANKIDPIAIMDANSLTDTNLIVGQVLVLPGAKGDPIPTPKPTRRPSSGGGGSGVAPQYSGGSWHWPVVGGGNYISQYFHYGHYGIDIAASYGTPVVAALSGTVVYAGWASTGCGYTVYLRNSSSIYTMYCHNSSLLVHVGQTVSKGQQIARIGSSGNATGPHLHFAVSIGYPHESGSYFVNPLRYY
jgi:murein DD-endopeptidase MepM/ murein hydrolase activator NlpD